jgi:hypothetical protein
MFIILAALLLAIGIFVALRGRAALPAGRTGYGWTMVSVGLLLVALAALMLWAVFAFYSQPCLGCM